MSSKKTDCNKLYKELQSELEEEKMYWIRNDAKIRAATTCKTYDEFRDIVAAAHLQPITKKDTERKPNN